LVSLYNNWVLKRWETPISDIQRLALVSLTDTRGVLSLVLEDQCDPLRRRFHVDFTRYPGYRNLLEEYRLELWQALAETGATGRSLQVTVSPWIAELKEHEPLLDAEFPNLKHWLISTEDDVIEVLSDATPLFQKMNSTGADTPPVGKSTILYAPEDRENIEHVFRDVKRHNRPADD